MYREWPVPLSKQWDIGHEVSRICPPALPGNAWKWLKIRFYDLVAGLFISSFIIILRREAVHFCSCKLSWSNTAVNQLVIQRGVLLHTVFESEFPKLTPVTSHTITPRIFFSVAKQPGRTLLNERSARRRGRYLHNTQQTQETNVSALSGIWTGDPSNQVAAGICLRPVVFNLGYAYPRGYAKTY
jgi:hypothetical protein